MQVDYWFYFAPLVPDPCQIFLHLWFQIYANFSTLLKPAEVKNWNNNNNSVLINNYWTNNYAHLLFLSFFFISMCFQDLGNYGSIHISFLQYPSIHKRENERISHYLLYGFGFIILFDSNSRLVSPVYPTISLID